MGEPIACDFGGGLTEICHKMCHVAERQKRLMFRRILARFKEQIENIIRSVSHTSLQSPQPLPTGTPHNANLVITIT
jgi:hypothetical protein